MKFNFMRIAVIAICAVAVSSCKEQEAPVPVIPEYEVMNLVESNCKLESPASASIRGQQDIDIYPQVSGTLTKIMIEEGQKVKEGDILFVVDQVPYKAALASAQASVAVAAAALETAELVFESKSKLYDQGVVSSFEYISAKNSLASAEAGLAQAKAMELSAKNNLSYTEVKSPTDGVVGVLPYRVGTLVSSQLAQPLTTVSDNKNMYVYFSLNENQLLSLVRDYGSKDSALVYMPKISLQLNDKSIYPYQGKISSISGVIDRSTGTVSLRAEFPNLDGLLHSGGSGNVIIPTERENVVIIPRVASFELQDKVFVYTIVEGKTKSIQIEVTRVNGGANYIVESGLKAGDQIVTEGVGLLREGTPIKAKVVHNSQVSNN